MTLTGRDLVSISDLSDSEIKALFGLADDLGGFTRGRTDLCDGRILATLFYEPSTRTRLSFEAAMLRLSGQVISCADARVSSAAKGETIADTVRVVESYADVIVIRHPLAGAARVAADYARVPVINAGDGAREHPTQTLLDLYTIRQERGHIEGAQVALCGDLKHARTAHSLACALARFGARVICVAPPALAMPASVLEEVTRLGGVAPREYASLDQMVDGAAVISTVDAIYVTRIQRERFASEAGFAAVSGSYAITEELLQRAKPDCLILHPLPRIDELAYGLDQDPRAAYFRQAAYGLPVRMALIASLLAIGEAPAPAPRTGVVSRPGLRCANAKCVMSTERYLEPEFQAVPGRETVRCAYCEQEVGA